MEMELLFANLADRHVGVSVGISTGYEEAARVCLDRHHLSPVAFVVRVDESECSADANWKPGDQALRYAWANDIDATEAGAYAIALATVELTGGLIAVRRAETRTGADYYVDYPGADPDDLENAFRLEISGTANGDESEIESRLKRKLEQVANGVSNLPGIAIVVGFAQLRIVSAKMVSA